MTTKYIFKICGRDEWEAATLAGVYHGSELDLKDGFIHFSTDEQVLETARLHFSGVSGLVLVKVDAERFSEAIKWEESRNNGLFPHLYGVLPVSNIEWVRNLPLGDDRQHLFPNLE